MKISLMRRRFKLKKKIKLEFILLISGMILFFISMLSFVINACTIQNVSLAWFLFALIILGSALVIWGMILFILHNKEKIRKYLDEITK